MSTSAIIPYRLPAPKLLFDKALYSSPKPVSRLAHSARLANGLYFGILIPEGLLFLDWIASYLTFRSTRVETQLGLY